MAFKKYIGAENHNKPSRVCYSSMSSVVEVRLFPITAKSGPANRMEGRAANSKADCDESSEAEAEGVFSGEFEQYWNTRILLHCALNLDIAETVAAATTRACAKKKAMSQRTTGRTGTVTKASGGQKGISTGKCFLGHA